MEENVKYIKIKNVIIEKDILTEYFCCDHEACKNQCCWLDKDQPEGVILTGAVLEESEKSALEDNYQGISEFLTDDEKDFIEENGVYTTREDIPHSNTPFIIDDEKGYCAYCQFADGEICGCAIQNAYDEGKSDFRKPAYCSLYPISMRLLKEGSAITILTLDRDDVCQAAFLKGKAEGVKVFQFCRDILIEKFGSEFYEKLESLAEEI